MSSHEGPSPTAASLSRRTNHFHEPDQQNGSKTMMNLMNEDLARAQMSARLGEAQQLRRGHQLARGPSARAARPSRPRSRRVSPSPALCKTLTGCRQQAASRAP